MSDSESEYSPESDHFDPSSSVPSSEDSESDTGVRKRKGRSRSAEGNKRKLDSKRLKSEVITIEDSSDESDFNDEGLAKRLQRSKSKNIPAGLKTTGLSNSESDDSDDEFDHDDDGEGLTKRLKGSKSKHIPAGLKTTGISDYEIDADDDDDGNGNVSKKIKDDGSERNKARYVTPYTSFSSEPDSSPPPRLKQKPDPSPEECDSYIKNLEKSNYKRTFSLLQIPDHQVISTGRTIKQLKAWKGLWPPLREFLQNTVDHLNLMDGKTGRRRECITMEAQRCGDDSRINISCQGNNICSFVASEDELVIEQSYTYPIATRSLDTGVVDTTKTSASNQAGGFGDGFKTAAVALLSHNKGKDFRSLNWFFYAFNEKTKISWSFEGLTKESIATFAKCEVLQVIVDKSKITKNEISTLSKESGGNYVMRQVIKVKSIGKAFLEKAVPMFSVFWDLDENSLISSVSNKSRGLGGDFIGPTTQPDLFQGVLGSIKPKAGVYVRGIWIRNSKIKDAIMSFFGNRLEVTGRDRNEVDDDELLKASIYILHRCRDMKLLRKLLLPLRQNSTSKIGEMSWLLKSPAFFNRVIENERDFIRHDVLNIPRGSIFMSSKTEESKNLFIAWASSFLKSQNTPLVFIEQGANKFLFEEVSEYELTERCVKIIKSKMKGGKRNKTKSHSVFTKFLTFLGIRQGKVYFSQDVGIAFTHGSDIYIPDCPLTRELIIRVLNVCHSRVEGITPESYSSLLVALLDNMKGGRYECTVEEATRIVSKAKIVQKSNSRFLHNGQRNQENSTNEIVELDSSDESENLENPYVKEMNELINQMGKGGRTGGTVGGAGFADDNAGDNECLRASSKMSPVRINSKFSLLCDKSTADSIENKTFDKKILLEISMLRDVLEEACSIIRQSVPALHTLLLTVKVAYDGKNDDYEAYYDGDNIIINFFAFSLKMEKVKKKSRDIVHDFVTVVTHEMAHALLPNAGHGPGWRACHMNMIGQIMKFLERK